MTENADPVGQYEKFELTLNFTAAYTKPYDPDPSVGGLDVWAIFNGPGGIVTRVNGFYMDGTGGGTGNTWRLRFATGVLGSWSYVVHVRDNSGTASSASLNFTVNASGHKGFIRASTVNPRFFAHENGQVFWGIGHNNAYQYGDGLCPWCYESPSMTSMAANGENMGLIWLQALRP